MFTLAHAAVGDKADFTSLSRAKFYQGKLSADDLKGKVVFIEYWGMHCPPCLATMPQLQELYAKYKDKGFVLIAAHHQRATPEEVAAYFKQNKLTFPSCEFYELPQGPVPSGLPYSVLVGANGKVVAMGRPSEVEPKVEAEMKKVLGGAPILCNLTLKKYQKLETTVLEGAPNIEAKIEPLRSKSGDAEAQAICKEFDAWVESCKTAISECRDKDALEFVAKAAALRKSVPSVTDYDEAATGLMADPAYAKLSDIRKKMKAMRKKMAEGKKVSPKAVEAMQEGVRAVNSEDAGIQGSAANLASELENLATEAAASGSKKTKDNDRKKRGATR